MADIDSRGAVERAILLAQRHPEVLHVQIVNDVPVSGCIAADLTFNVNLPNAWKADGVSPNGIRAQEILRLDFPDSYPLRPPTPSLRPDFDRSHPHLQPWLHNGRPVPCLYDGHLAELIQLEGFRGILNQAALWFDRAATDTLIDPAQGWEPARRDSLDHTLVGDNSAFRNLVDSRGGHRYCLFEYFAFKREHKLPIVTGTVATSPITFSPSSASDIVGLRQFRNTLYHGRSVTLVLWPGKTPPGSPIICDSYVPDDIENLSQLIKRVTDFGCGTDFNSQLQWLQRCLSNTLPGPLILGVILCVRRPFHLIGSQSDTELYGYVIEISSPEALSRPTEVSVGSAALRDRISVSLLREMSDGDTGDRLNWTLAGCGSLGSKIAIHLARSGRGPTCVIDKAGMRPHNAARHALIPSSDNPDFLWNDYKAPLLATAILALGQPVEPHVADIIRLSASEEGCRQLCPRNTWALLNATAFLTVREALAATAHLSVRVIETLLFSNGSVGVITIEGPDRSPNTGDLITETYGLIAEDPDLSAVVFGKIEAGGRRQTGEGCGSFTMRMTDSRLSLFAAGISEALIERQKSGLSTEGGEIFLGKLDSDGMGVQWQRHLYRPILQVGVDDAEWRIRLSQRAVIKIEKEVALWPDVETGGILVGRLSEASRIFHVIDTLPAPRDSTRSKYEFVLGRLGITESLRNYSTKSGWSLYCLGTWHSHLATSPASPRDKRTAQAIAIARFAPSVLLIHTPTGFNAIIAEERAAIPP